MQNISNILPFAQVQFTGKFIDSGNLPPFTGPTIRGGLGVHLKRTVCHVRDKNCEQCLVQPTCAYSYIFEGKPPENRSFMRLYPNIPQPFVLNINFDGRQKVAQGDKFSFGLKLFGRAIDFFPYVAYSIFELGKSGLGKNKVKFEIDHINQSERAEPIFAKGQNKILPLQKQSVKLATNDADKLVLHLQTPLRLKVQGKFARSITFGNIARAAVRRLSILSNFYGFPLKEIVDASELLAGCEDIETLEGDTDWFSFKRFSGRQKRRISMGGLTGIISFKGNIKPYVPILKLAEVTNLGKATSFGFGKIQPVFKRE